MPTNKEKFLTLSEFKQKNLKKIEIDSNISKPQNQSKSKRQFKNK